MEYIKLEAEVILFDSDDDIITASGGLIPGENGDFTGGDNFNWGN